MFLFHFLSVYIHDLSIYVWMAGLPHVLKNFPEEGSFDVIYVFGSYILTGFQLEPRLLQHVKALFLLPWAALQLPVSLHIYLCLIFL